MDQGSFSICLFGPHLFRWNNRPLALGLRGATRDLLRYLVINAGCEIRRECIADQFWRQSCESRQRSALNSAIWRISKKLPDHPGIALCVRDSTVSLEIDSSVPVDTHILTDLVHQGSTADRIDDQLAKQLSQALNASEAPFMDGLAEDWSLCEQERVFNIRMRGLALLMNWYGDGRRYEDALEVGRRLLTADPFREIVQIDMMWLYVLNGQRAQALKQYQAYSDLLVRELDIEPMAETRALYDYIRSDLNYSPRARGEANSGPGDFAHQNRTLDVMLVAIEQSRRELYQVLRTQLG